MIIIEVGDPARGERQRFDSAEVALIAAQEEVQHWEAEHSQAGVKIPAVDPAHSSYFGPLNAWRAAVDTINSYRRRGDKNSDLKIDTPSLAYESSPAAKALLWTISNVGLSPGHYAAVAARLGEGSINWSDIDAVRGVLMFDWIQERFSARSNQSNLLTPHLRVGQIEERINGLTAAVQHVDELVIEASSLAAEQVARAKNGELAYKAEAVENWRKISEQADRVRDNVNSSVRDKLEELDTAIVSASHTVQTWVDARNEQRQLAKPAALWAARSVDHAAGAKRLRWWGVGVGVAGLLLAVLIADLTFAFAGRLFEDAIIPGELKNAAGTLRPTFHYQLILTGVVTVSWLTMYLWAMRVLVRLYTTEHRLSIDASARGAMNDTYLGLIEAGAADEKDRQVVLAALFRPVQDGIVRDDGPLGFAPASVLSGLLGNKSAAS